MTCLPAQVERCAALSERLDLFQVLLDHPDALEQLKKRPLKAGRQWHVWLKLDCGNGRGKYNPQPSWCWLCGYSLIVFVPHRSWHPALGARSAHIGPSHRWDGGRGANRGVRALWKHVQLQRSRANTSSCSRNHQLYPAVHGKVRRTQNKKTRMHVEAHLNQRVKQYFMWKMVRCVLVLWQKFVNIWNHEVTTWMPAVNTSYTFSAVISK